jgi:phage regulator Rha-like protein
MPKTNVSVQITDEAVISKIILIRGAKVMVDKDLAELYGVTTKALNQQVKRNKDRFPEDFMFQLNQEEKDEVVAKCDHLKNLKFSPALPNVFTEFGVMMLASVLNSETAIQVNIQIVRVFAKMRELLLTNKDILLNLEKMEKRLTEHDENIVAIFNYISKLVNSPQPPRRKIGFRRRDEDENVNDSSDHFD